MLTIEQFIKTSLVEIASGIKAANEIVAADGYEFAPPHFRGGVPADGQLVDSVIRFDLAVTVAEKKDGGFGVVLATAKSFFGGEAKAGYGKSSESSTVSRVQFEIKAFFNSPKEDE